MEDGQIDYSSFSRAELVEVLATINREKFPRNYENAREALKHAPEHKPGLVVPSSPEPAPAEPRTPRLSNRASLFLFAGLVGAFFTAADLWSRHVLGPEKFSALVILLNTVLTVAVSTASFRFGLLRSKKQHTVWSVAISATMTWSVSTQLFRYFYATNPAMALLSAVLSDVLVPIFLGWKAAMAPKPNGV